ncbi:MAG: fimbrillin family protein [Bacteroidales bacterium]|nr:fimbrillin family protein [Bacteroidales bacterium]
MKRVIYLTYMMICLVMAACSDDLYLPSDAVVGHVIRFEVEVSDGAATRGDVLSVSDNRITKDIKAGDSFGMFIIDGTTGKFVTDIEGKNARNIKMTTPDGMVWNLDSEVKEVVHKLGYKYMAYYPYSEAFDGCNVPEDVTALLIPPAEDQSLQAATDWLVTEATSPGTNAVTTLRFHHKYAKIEIYNSYLQEHVCNWVSAYKFTKTVDEDNIEHYRYILDAESPVTLPISGKYSVGNSLTGMKQLSYKREDVSIVNGTHSIVYTYRVDERCAVDLGLPSGVKWSPINFGAETDSYMDAGEIASAQNLPGRRLAWGELFEKDVYNYDTYINDPYQENGSSLLPANISWTVYDPVHQYWGGHWTLPNSDDLQEFIDNVEEVKREKVFSEELNKEVDKITFRSIINGNEISMLCNGYKINSTYSVTDYLYYMSGSINGYAYCNTLTNYTDLRRAGNHRYIGYNIRPVLKELYTYTTADKKEILTKHIDEMAIDLGITKTVTEVVDGESREVTYKILWSPFNYGVDSKVVLSTYNGKAVDEDKFLTACIGNPGMRLAWGDIEEPAKFNYTNYMNSPIAAKYAYNNESTTDLDTRDLKEEDDIVQLNWPDGWYIPTAKDLQLLVANTTIVTETINGKKWFKLTGKNGYEGTSIMIPSTGYVDNKDNTETWGSDAYLTSSTIGTKGSVHPDPYTVYVLQVNTKKLLPTAGRPTGFMLRPVKYVRID